MFILRYIEQTSVPKTSRNQVSKQVTMGKKNKNNSSLTSLMYNLQGLDYLSDDDLGQTFGGNSNHIQNDDIDDGNISADVPL
jgi:hypothetical protein